MNNLQIFKNDELGQIRAIEKDGQPWFVAKDVCEILEIQNTTDAIKRLDTDEVTRFNLGGLTGEANLVNEYGLYSLILGSRKPEAKKFKRWVTHEVLPSIRKTGGYQKSLTPQEIMREQLAMIDDVSERVDKLENTMTIDYGQQKVLERLVGQTVIASLGGKDTMAYKETSKKVFKECNRDIQDRFNVNSRSNVPKLKFEDACKYIRHWEPCTNTKIAIAECNNQMCLA